MSSPFDLSGKTALVTGGGGRLGAAFTDALRDAGAEVVTAGRSRGDYEVDLRDEASVDSLFERVAAERGGVDVLVNNAGIASAAGMGEVSAAEFAEVLAVNVTGAYLCAQRAAPLMRERGGGKIVNVGSIYGTVAADQRIYEGSDMVRSSSPYAAAKSALVNLTRDLAVRLAPWNVQVNMVSPGGIEHEQPEEFRRRYEGRTPAGRMGRPEDVGATVVYLAAPASDYVTGQNVHVDGGFTAW